MTYTCATEGCGGLIEWTGITWVHTREQRRVNAHVAHPVGGANTTPPEELERDVKKVTMDDVLIATLWSDARSTSSPWHPKYLELKSLVAQYADQAVEEDTAGLREQLDRALVSKFKVGDRVTWGEYQADVTGTEISYALNIRGENARIFPMAAERIMESDLSLAPQETECQQWCHDESYHNEYGSWKVCPWCGESLTKEGEA